MDVEKLYKYKTVFIIACLLVCSLLAVYVRIIPLLDSGGINSIDYVSGDDPVYNLRQVELIIKNFPAYPWFDPMTYFPYATTINWGPLFTTLAAVACLALGATTRPDIINVSLVVPAVIAGVAVPVMFIAGRKLVNWKTGLIAALFVAVIGGQYFQRSQFGYFDHHIAEVFFGSVFCIAYIYTLAYAKDNPISLKKYRDHLPQIGKLAGLSAITGLFFVIGLYVMPTLIVYAMIVAIFTFVQFCFDFYKRVKSDYLVIINTVVFSIATLGFMTIGIQVKTLGFDTYGIIHPIAYGLTVITTLVLYSVSLLFEGKRSWSYPVFLAVAIAILVGLLRIVYVDVYNLIVVGLNQFFGQAIYGQTVQELRPWGLFDAWYSFGIGFFLMLAGFVILVYYLARDKRPEHMFLMVWSLMMLVATMQHVRYEYFLAFNAALLAGVAVSFVLDIDYSTKKLVKKSSKRRAKETVTTEPIGSWNYKTFAGAIVIALAVGFVITSVNVDYQLSKNIGTRMNPDWKESLVWLGQNSPDPGMDIGKNYEKENFTYPAQAYGVMSWWDYGHMITYFSNRIPNANPFQQGVGGIYNSTGSSTFFLAPDEETAESVLDTLKTKYIVTDIEMDTAKFWAMSTWYNATVGSAPYQAAFLVQNPQDGQYQQVLLQKAPYYHTMIARLHNFDGTMATPSSVLYIEYDTQNIAKMGLPLITQGMVYNSAADADIAVQKFERYGSLFANGVAIMSESLKSPVDTVPALQHYRLVHESPTSTMGDLKYVKVFERVKGANIAGNGTVSTVVTTNTGRVFTYAQESIGGRFVLPYAGVYNSTGGQFTITDEDVTSGKVL